MVDRARFAFVILAAAAPLLAQGDEKGSSDHPLFPNRMPGYRITTYQSQEFGSYKFQTQPPAAIEGKYTRIGYYLIDANQHPGGVAIRRNYENAIKAIGGEVAFTNSSISVLKATHNGAEVWVEVLAGANRNYYLNIVERAPMSQIIKADAMAAAIDRDGFIALDIHFATGSADILPESEPLIAEMVTMLKNNPSLRVGIEGHTDNTGTPAGNKTLSENRAKSVTAALVKGGIAADRLSPAGFGQERPIADNRTEEGRAKNRRVELTKR